MNFYSSVFLIFFIGFFCHAQEISIQQQAELRGVFNEEKMLAFKENNPGLTTEIVFLNSFETLSYADSLLFLMGLSGVRETKNSDGKTIYYKLFESTTAENCRVRTIFFDGTKLTVDSINLLRELIFANLKAGKSFESQYELYNMDNRPNHGDLGWTKPEALLEPFTSLVSINEIAKPYAVDIPYMNWFYVAEKLKESKAQTTKKFLKVSVF